METLNITHPNRFGDFHSALSIYKDRISQRGDLPYITVDEQLEVLEDFAKTPLGKHVILTGGANGVWTDYIITYPWTRSCGARSKLTLSRIEYFVLFESPVVVAQRELFLHSQRVAQEHVKDGAVLVSLPCGMMRDLIELDYSRAEDVQLVGIDIDPEAIEAAKTLAKEKNVNHINFLKEDAWALTLKNEADFITSIGLNVYESDRERVVALYKQIYEALKPQGVFFTGVFTYPPGFEKKSDWSSSLPQDQALMDKILMDEVLDAQFQNFRTLDEMKQDFFDAGFKDVTIVPDKYCVFPSIIAKKGD